MKEEEVEHKMIQKEVVAEPEHVHDPKPAKVAITADSQTASIEKEDAAYDEPSQVSLSQTDETIRNLGDLNEVVGSQSMLSQELLNLSQGEENDEEEPNSQKSNLATMQCSQQTETSYCMAQRYGLLTKEEEKPQELESSQTSVLIAEVIRDDLSQTVPASQSSQEVAPRTATPPPKRTFPHMSDTPVRESECFGSLLDAVQRITEQEEVNAKLYALQNQSNSQVDHRDATNPQEPTATTTATKPKKKKPSPKRKLPATISSPPTPPKMRKKQRKSTAALQKEKQQRQEREIAQRAADLAEKTAADPEMAKKLLLSMALVRENPRGAPSSLPPLGATVPEGFFWAHYPPLESVLKKHMAEYYELSTTKCQSAQQQAFNNDLVILVRAAAKEEGWRFDATFSDKGLRDRIRCYYKTHIQNAKKRLRTMVRNPTKRANARHLCAHLDLIQQVKPGEAEMDGDDKNTTKVERVEPQGNGRTTPILPTSDGFSVPLEAGGSSSSATTSKSSSLTKGSDGQSRSHQLPLSQKSPEAPKAPPFEPSEAPKRQQVVPSKEDESRQPPAPCRPDTVIKKEAAVVEV